MFFFLWNALPFFLESFLTLRDYLNEDPEKEKPELFVATLRHERQRKNEGNALINFFRNSKNWRKPQNAISICCYDLLGI